MDSHQERVRQISAEIDKFGQRHFTRPEVAAVPQRAMAPPSYGEPQRDAVNSIVDGIVRDISEQIAALRSQLDEIEQQVLEGAAKSKAALQGQIGVCVRINDEISHMTKVIADMRPVANE